jgi:hypothetical protein
MATPMFFGGTTLGKWTSVEYEAELKCEPDGIPPIRYEFVFVVRNPDSIMCPVRYT